MNEMIRTYKWWSYHGEDNYINSTFGSNSSIIAEDEHEISEHDDMHAMLDDFNTRYNNMNEFAEQCNDDNPNKAARNFFDLLNDAETELYPGCKKISKFQFLVTLLTLKTYYGWIDRSFTKLLKVLKRSIPFSETHPCSFYEAENYMHELGMGCKKIDACLNDYSLYYGKFADYVSCPTCGTSRWQSSKDADNIKSTTLSKKSKNIPNKIFRHFHFIPRLQWLYMCFRTSKEMRWHKEQRCDDGKLRHSVDAFAWKSFDRKHQEFSSETRNVRLGLASDGFNPFGLMCTNNSVWSVVLVPYNLPPWMCMKTPNFIISLIIPGPGQPENDMDVYLQPLIDELNIYGKLWFVHMMLMESPILICMLLYCGQ
ncbi:hypothetical protein KSP39_PZI019267 [Platanthera zijinensis]|uniref:Transposase n=1 Tax=Platanthera zijinensis TaxID=2320716 RepID=A0AAP0B235_9ASPA